MTQNDTKCDATVPSELTLQQEQAINGLLSGSSLSKIAEEIGVSRSTLYRWKQNSAFCAALNDAKYDLSAHLQLRMSNVADSLVDVLQKAVMSPGAFASRNPELVFRFLQTVTESTLMRAGAPLSKP